MTNVFISLFPDPPRGFEYRKPTKRDLRGSRVAVLCHSLKDALALTKNFTEYVYGLVITEGEKFSHSSIGPELWHLTVPHVMIPDLHKMVSIFFDIMANGQKALDENSSLKIELSLSRKIQKQTQSSYNQSTGRLINKVSEIRHIIDYAQFGVFRTDVMGRIFLANPALIKIFGYTSLEAMNKVGLQNIYQRKSDRDHLLSLVKQGPVREFETRFIRADGAIIDALLTLYPIFGEDDDLQFLEGNLIDVTERKLAIKELNSLRNYLSNIIDSMPSVLLGVDTGGRVTLWNKTAEKTTGTSASMARGRYLADVFPKMSTEMEKIASSIQTREIILEKKRPIESGNVINYEDVTIFPLIGHDLDGAVIRIDDVSKQCELEEQLNHSRKMDAIGQLAGGIAHDFNNMLGAIIGAAELLKSPDGSLGDEEIECVDMIINASTRAADLTAKLLAFGRKGKIISSVVDIHNVIDDTVSILRSTIDKKIAITVNYNASVHTIAGDASGLHSTLLNLGINASNAMPNGGKLVIGTTNVVLDSTYCTKSPFEIEEGRYIEIGVHDTGCGIPTDNLLKIFEPFFTTSELGSGSGLGLAAVYGTVQDHMGAISVSSQVGVGTSFRIYLPCPEENSHIQQNETSTVTGSGQIMLVDDEELIRVVGKLMLEEMGYSVLLAENGKIAVEIFKEKFAEIDLVIMDMVMPEMNGREAFTKMREIHKNCKVIISSGFSKSKDIEASMQEGLSGFIQKPYRNSELSLLLAQVMST